MSLGEKQRLFAKLVGTFIVWIYNCGKGYEITLGEAARSKIQAAADAKEGIGISNSLHIIRLAIDLNLFINGVYQADSETYKEIGEYWKSLYPLNRWGGDFNNPDGNHFSLEHEGVK